MQILAALVHDDLLAIEVRQAEGRRDVDDGAGGKARLDVVDADEALHIGQGERKEGRVGGADHQRVIAEVASAGVERQQAPPSSDSP